MVIGTNYYWHERPCCPTCGHARGEEKHIGKSSLGWCFSLHVYPEEGILDWTDWLRVLDRGTIKNEYGDILTLQELAAVVENRSGKNNFDKPLPKAYQDIGIWSYRDWYDFHTKNHSEPGPNGLLRHNIGEACLACLRHGSGTWDCIQGDFS